MRARVSASNSVAYVLEEEAGEYKDTYYIEAFFNTKLGLPINKTKCNTEIQLQESESGFTTITNISNSATALPKVWFTNEGDGYYMTLYGILFSDPEQSASFVIPANKYFGVSDSNISLKVEFGNWGFPFSPVFYFDIA